ncbi:GNAT family N-acetyltransferase [Paenibacillus thiaminolyticus]|uniref:GNAT family N-acetyltransferase n=1 Tax=Paenibacillus thiaminolyticus TaxID=49283 RepID=UPI002543B04A|nr:GNAT family N-acetyltransferase [Paenibacillus thiaminolyticus]WII38233.1 GNAT family N-acetyltransferase [Paenibacillus thiaminolyticus]
MTTEVRLATIDDAEALSGLNQAFNGGERRPVAEIIESMNKSGEFIAVATMDGKVAGFACAQRFASFCYREAQGEITEMYVEPSARRKGLAVSMISLLEEKLAAHGVKNIKILTGSDNAAAIKTYERCGYVQDDELLLQKEM